MFHGGGHDLSHFAVVGRAVHISDVDEGSRLCGQVSGPNQARPQLPHLFDRRPGVASTMATLLGNSGAGTRARTADLLITNHFLVTFPAIR